MTVECMIRLNASQQTSVMQLKKESERELHVLIVSEVCIPFLMFVMKPEICIT